MRSKEVRLAPGQIALIIGLFWRPNKSMIFPAVLTSAQHLAKRCNMPGWTARLCTIGKVV
eukprot:1131835-Alexandrium_andersonii.AAC.1